MPKILIQKEAQCSANDAYNKIKTLLSDDKDLRKLDPHYQCQFDDANHTGSAKGRQFSANLKLNGSNPTNVELAIDLPMIMTPFKGMVESTLKNKLDKIFS